MASVTRIVYARAHLDAPLGAGLTAGMPWHDGQATYEVPINMVLALFNVVSTALSGNLVVEVSDNERTYQIVASSVLLNPPIVFKSGARVTASVRNTNPGVATAGGTTSFQIYGVLIPSNEYDRFHWPESVPPAWPRPM